VPPYTESLGATISSSVAVNDLLTNVCSPTSSALL